MMEWVGMKRKGRDDMIKSRESDKRAGTRWKKRRLVMLTEGCHGYMRRIKQVLPESFVSKYVPDGRYRMVSEL